MQHLVMSIYSRPMYNTSYGMMRAVFQQMHHLLSVAWHALNQPSLKASPADACECRIFSQFTHITQCH